MMNRTKGKLWAALALLMALGMTAGGVAAGGAAEGEAIRIGAVQLIEHRALDAAYQGFKDGLAEAGYVDGEGVALDFQNAQGDMSNLSTIGDRFVSQKKDLILAITTDAAQAMAGKTESIPIVATAVTSYAIAGLVDSEEAPGGNVTGTSDMNPVAAQIGLALALVPNARTVGLIYNSSEDNSVLQADIAKGAIAEKGLSFVEMTVTGVNDVQQVMQSLVGKCDVIYIPTDNTLAAAMPIVYGVAGPAGVPVICGESNMVMKGGLATMGLDYYALGKKTAAMAVQILQGADPAGMPIQYADGSEDVTINGLVAREMGIEIPAKYQGAVVEPEG